MYARERGLVSRRADVNYDRTGCRTAYWHECDLYCVEWGVKRYANQIKGRQFDIRYQQTIGPSTAEGTPTRQIGDTNQLTIQQPRVDVCCLHSQVRING